MPMAKRLTSYPDVQALFDKALESEKGLRLTFETHNEAVFQAGRFNAFRKQDRLANAKIYPADHRLHHASVYDGLMVQIRENVVNIKKLDINAFTYEELE